MLKRFLILAAIIAAPLSSQAQVLTADQLNFTARQLLQIELQDDRRISYSGLDGQIGPQTIAAITQWQQLEGMSHLNPLDKAVVCTLIRKGVQGHGSGSKLPGVCR